MVFMTYNIVFEIVCARLKKPCREDDVTVC